MLQKKFLLGAILTAAVCLNACANGGTEVTETIAETAAERFSAAEKTKATNTETETLITTVDNQPESFSICGNEYTSEDIFITIDGNTLTEADKENIRGMEKLSAVSIENPTVSIVEFFAEDTNVKKINFANFSGGISEYTDALKAFKIIIINADNYSEKDACELFRRIPKADIMYNKSSGGLHDVPSDEIVFDFDHFISYDEDYIFYSNIKDKPLTAHFTNYTEEIHTAEKAEIFYNGTEGIEVLEFADGQKFLKTNISVGANGEAEFVIDNSMFDFENAKTGLYTIRFTFDNSAFEQDFFVANSDGGDFLTEEQRALLNEAYETSCKYIYEGWEYPSSWGDPAKEANISDESAETLCKCFTKEYVDDHVEWLRLNKDGSLYDVSDNRGGSYVYSGHFFSPVYLDDEQIIFKATVVNYHVDNPYFMWYSSINYRMVMTENGWRFDKFKSWY